MIRSLAIAAVLEAILIFFLILQPMPHTEALRGLPAIEVVTLSPETEVGLPQPAKADASDKSVTKETAKAEVGVSDKPLRPAPSAAKPASGPPTHPVAGDRLDRGVVLVSGSNPVYPKHAAAYNIETEVKVKILVKSDGTVESVTPISGEDQWGFSRAVRTAVMNWQFQPGSVSGYSASFYIVKSFKFNLD